MTVPTLPVAEDSWGQKTKPAIEPNIEPSTRSTMVPITNLIPRPPYLCRLNRGPKSFQIDQNYRSKHSDRRYDAHCRDKSAK